MSNKILKFGATWCNPCKQSGKFIETNFPDKEYQDIDVTTNPELAQKYGVRNVPTFILLNSDGDVEKRFTGFDPSKIKEIFQSV